MFWKRKEKITHSALGPVLQIPPPPRKEFSTMLELLRDAEKFDNAGEKDVSNATLKTLVHFIDRYLAKQQAP